MQIKRHYGRHVPTDTRLVVTYPVLPNTTDATLVVHVDRLPAALKESVLRAVDTNAGQSSINVADVLGRTMYQDSGKSVFQVLHEGQYLKRVSIDEVEMKPTSAMAIPLRTVLIESGLIARPVADPSDRFNAHAHNAQVDESANGINRARNLLAEAQLLQQEAERKREQAYGIAPSLKPTPEAVVVEVAPVDPASLLADYSEATPETQA
jgi:hypothetical protein